MDSKEKESDKTFAQKHIELNLMLAGINTSGSFDELTSLDDKIITLWLLAESSQQKVACIDLVATLQIPLIRDAIICSLASKAYESKDYEIAFYAFLKGAQLGITIAKNNLAYMVRRSECNCDGFDNAVVALKLLIPGIREKEPFSIVNAALVLCLLFNEDQDWRTADNLLQYLPDGAKPVFDWWAKLANETEGYLVHFFLLRHNKVMYSNFGSERSIALYLTKNLRGFPAWLAEEYNAKSLDDILECYGTPGFEDILTDYIEKMPRSRASVDELLEAVKRWDLLPMYDALLNNLADFLSKNELFELKSDYSAKFSLPFPSEDQ